MSPQPMKLGFAEHLHTLEPSPPILLLLTTAHCSLVMESVMQSEAEDQRRPSEGT